MINKQIDFDDLKEKYKRQHYVRVENFLEDEYARKVSSSVFNEIAWDLCYLSGDGPVSIKESELRKYSPQQYADLNQKIMSRATQGFSYYYYRSDLVQTSNKILKRFYDDLCGKEFIEFCRNLTDEKTIEKLNGQLACFSPGCFLRKHTDKTDKENRVAAYVFNFTPVWNNDWGGHLHILDNDNMIIDTLEPIFNSVTFFKVPALHYVSQVANYATGRRFTATGWMLKPN